MSDRITAAEKLLAKWTASAERLRSEIAARRAKLAASKAAYPPTVWFGVWEARVDAIAAAEGSLARVKRYIASARDRLDNARTEAGRRAKLLPLKASLERRADKIAEKAPAVQERWKTERAREPDRVKKRTKEIGKRNTKDLRASTRWFPGGSRRRPKTPPPPLPLDAETFPTGRIVPYVPPPAGIEARDDLVPGDYRVVDPKRLGQLLDAPAPPKRWTGYYVGQRMAEAHATLRRLPMTVRPKEHASMWPNYRHEGVEWAHQASTGSLSDRNRVIRGTSADEVARMNEALAWPMEYLGGRPELAHAVNEWAFWERIDPDECEADRFNEGLDIIAAALNRRKVVVR
jgi:hypothetical protein